MQKFKKNLARIFDNDLRTKQWENYPDYAIIGLIVLSTLSVFKYKYKLIHNQATVVNWLRNSFVNTESGTAL